MERKDISLANAKLQDKVIVNEFLEERDYGRRRRDSRSRSRS